MKNQRRYRTLALFVLTFVMVFSSFPLASFASTSTPTPTYQYTGSNVVNGSNIHINTVPTAWQKTALIEVKDLVSNALIGTYCMKQGVSLNPSALYTLVALSDYTINAERIRNIVLHSYPNVTFQEFRTAANDLTLSDADIIAASQLAIWSVEQDIYMLNAGHYLPKIEAAAEYLKQLPGVAKPERVKLYVTRPVITQSDKTIRISFSYGPTTPTKDVLDLNYRLNCLTGFVEESKTTVDNVTSVILSKTYSNLNCVETFSRYSVSVFGKQAFSDVYALRSATGEQPMVITVATPVSLCTASKCLPSFEVKIPHNTCNYSSWSWNYKWNWSWSYKYSYNRYTNNNYYYYCK